MYTYVNKRLQEPKGFKPSNLVLGVISFKSFGKQNPS